MGQGLTDGFDGHGFSEDDWLIQLHLSVHGPKKKKYIY